MAEDLKVSTIRLRETSVLLTDGSVEIAQTMTRMRNAVDTVVNDGWNGAGSQSFIDLYQQWADSGLRLQESLTGIASQLNTAAGIYDESETQVTTGFRA